MNCCPPLGKMVRLIAKTTKDLTVTEYNEYYEELLKQALIKQDINKDDIRIKSVNGECMFKIMEKL